MARLELDNIYYRYKGSNKVVQSRYTSNLSVGE